MVPYVKKRPTGGTEWPVQNMNVWTQDDALKCDGIRSRSQESYMWCVVWSMDVVWHVYVGIPTG